MTTNFTQNSENTQENTSHTITINQELRDYIDPLTSNELLALEQSILREGCRDALVLWGELLVDGHNRYAICQKHALPFKTIQNERFSSIEDVKLWMIDNHLARRSVSGFQRGVLALRKKEIVTARRKQAQEHKLNAEIDSTQQLPTIETFKNTTPDPVQVETREEIAKLAGISNSAVGQIEKIRKAATPELVEAVRLGTISINAAATIASLPSEEQVIAVAGGKKELQQTARQIRQTRAGLHNDDSEGASNATNNVTNNATNKAINKAITKAYLEEENKSLKAENAVLKIKIDELIKQLSENN